MDILTTSGFGSRKFCAGWRWDSAQNLAPFGFQNPLETADFKQKENVFVFYQFCRFLQLACCVLHTFNLYRYIYIYILISFIYIYIYYIYMLFRNFWKLVARSALNTKSFGKTMLRILFVILSFRVLSKHWLQRFWTGPGCRRTTEYPWPHQPSGRLHLVAKLVPRRQPNLRTLRCQSRLCLCNKFSFLTSGCFLASMCWKALALSFNEKLVAISIRFIRAATLNTHSTIDKYFQHALGPEASNHQLSCQFLIWWVFCQEKSLKFWGWVCENFPPEKKVWASQMLITLSVWVVFSLDVVTHIWGRMRGGVPCSKMVRFAFDPTCWLIVQTWACEATLSQSEP